MIVLPPRGKQLQPVRLSHKLMQEFHRMEILQWRKAKQALLRRGLRSSMAVASAARNVRQLKEAPSRLDFAKTLELPIDTTSEEGLGHTTTSYLSNMAADDHTNSLINVQHYQDPEAYAGSAGDNIANPSCNDDEDDYNYLQQLKQLEQTQSISPQMQNSKSGKMGKRFGVMYGRRNPTQKAKPVDSQGCTLDWTRLGSESATLSPRQELGSTMPFTDEELFPKRRALYTETLATGIRDKAAKVQRRKGNKAHEVK
jgi:hypothetical protein